MAFSKGIKIALIVMVFGIAFSAVYPMFPILKQSLHFLLDPTAGVLLNWNTTIGLIIVTAIISLILTLVQKFATNQEELRKLKKEQKVLQEEMKLYKDHPEKLMALQKKQFEFFPRTMDLTMAPLIYTSIPILLFFRWFYEYFASNPVKVFGFLSWFWAYIIFSIIFSTIYRKLFKMP